MPKKKQKRIKSAKSRKILEPKFKFGFSPDTYTPAGLRNMPEKQLRAEYTRMRDAAQKRLKRMMGSEFSTSAAVQQHLGGFATLKSLSVKGDPALTQANLQSAFLDVYRFLKAKSSTVYGQREIKAEALKSLARNFNLSEEVRSMLEEDWKAFGDFMDYARTYALSHMIDSERILSFYTDNMEAGANSADVKAAFTGWLRMEGENQLKELLDPVPGQGSSRYRKPEYIEVNNRGKQEINRDSLEEIARNPLKAYDPGDKTWKRTKGKQKGRQKE